MATSERRVFETEIIGTETKWYEKLAAKNEPETLRRDTVPTFYSGSQFETKFLI